MIWFDWFNEYVETGSTISKWRRPTTVNSNRARHTENLSYGPPMAEPDKLKGVVVYPPNTSN